MFQQFAVIHHFAGVLVHDRQGLFDVLLYLQEETLPIGFFCNSVSLPCFSMAGLVDAGMKHIVVYWRRVPWSVYSVLVVPMVG